MVAMKSSRIAGFHKLSYKEQINILAQYADLTADDLLHLRSLPGFNEAQLEIELREVYSRRIFSKRVLQKNLELSAKLASRQVENSICYKFIPLAVIPNLKINDVDVIALTAIEEPSNPAGAAQFGKLTRGPEDQVNPISIAHLGEQTYDTGGMKATYAGSFMMGQAIFTDIKDVQKFRAFVEDNKEKFIQIANDEPSETIKEGYGAQHVEDVATHKRGTRDYYQGIINIAYKEKDSQGGRRITSGMERVRDYVSSALGIQPIAGILTNDSPRRLTTVDAYIPLSSLETIVEGARIPGAEVARLMEELAYTAQWDDKRAITHNKGIMNGTHGVVTALSNDTRALEAAVHKYATRSGRMTGLSSWMIEGQYLHGHLALPLQIATVGGIINSDPQIRIIKKILAKNYGTEDLTAEQLAWIAGAVGLANNGAALDALTTKGISAAHGKLNIPNAMATAGIPADYYARIAPIMEQRREYSPTSARTIYEDILARQEKKTSSK